MSTLTDATNIFKVLDSENKGYITVDTFISSFHNFYKDNDIDKNAHENTLKSLIVKMQPDKDGKISFDNFLIVFKEIQPEKSVALKARRYSQYSIKRFLSAESFEIPVLDELDDENNADVTDNDHNRLNGHNRYNGDRPDDIECRSNTDIREDVSDAGDAGHRWEMRLINGNHRSHRFPEFDEITNHSTWPKRKLRCASSCKNLNDNPLLMPSAASRARDLFSAGASPRGSSDIHSVVFSQEIGSNFDLLQMQMKRLEQKLNSFHSNQFDLDEKQSSRIKEENKSLTQRINNLEDNIRESEEIAQSKLQHEKKEFKQKITRAEEEKLRQLESTQNRLYKLEGESADLSLEIRRYRDESEMMRVEKHALTEKLTESDIRLSSLQDEFDRLRHQSKIDVDNLKLAKAKYERILLDLDYKSDLAKEEPQLRIQTMNKLSQRHKEAEDLVEKLKLENKDLSEQINEAHRELLNKSPKEGRDPVNSSSGLSKELDHCSKEELMDMLARDKDSNFRLRDYIEKIIVKVMEKRPSLLEVGSMKK